MNSIELNEALIRNSVTRHYYQGIYRPKDVPRTFKEYPCFIIVNTVNAKRGQHWLVFFYITPFYLEIFDSLGFNLNKYNDITKCLQKQQGTIVFNSVVLQDSDSQTCGAHCLFFVYIKTVKKIALSTVLNEYYIKN